MNEQERDTFIGGSDAKHLLQLEPFGCRRQLFYEKAGVEPDFPPIENHHTIRGSKLEATACEEYGEKTGRALWVHPFVRHPRYSMMGVHPDRRLMEQSESGRPVQFCLGERPGLLEIKCPNVHNFRAIKAMKEVPPTHWLQVQWGLAVTGWTWGSIAFFNADLWDMAIWDVERDEEVIEQFGPAAEEFWQKVELQQDNDFEKLPRDDGRCQTCRWRAKCQDLGEMPDLVIGQKDVVEVHGRLYLEDESFAEDAAAYLKLRGMYLDVKKPYEEVRARLRRRMHEKPAVVCSTARLYWSQAKAKGQKPRATLHVEAAWRRTR